jgi:hypothetical protein
MHPGISGFDASWVKIRTKREWSQRRVLRRVFKDLSVGKKMRRRTFLTGMLGFLGGCACRNRMELSTLEDYKNI